MAAQNMNIYRNITCFPGRKSIKPPIECALEITTIVCTCVSLFCLLLSFITYSLFPLLRTLLGKNNMCLILSLFIAQTSYTKHDFFVYIKLFSLTGITWIGQIIDSFVPLSLFSFVVTILTGLQGLFILLSFVCNKRVIKLFFVIFNVIRKNDGGK
ncbi:uncharacterized protein LOC127722236 [Mytilus californianus]|uniref:uncharacterized protein LOC127722236 n=1 Tax=Mytilus californianus TaxID=6549 RepID=UPI002247D8D0|nr:uncharacterized protein LOC127722236 [Mytilus californianus]